MFSFLFASAQDTNMNMKKTDSQIGQQHKNFRKIKSRPPKKKKIYRDTRLGSSSPMYNTYKKNDKGAGAITTNPNKGGSGSQPIVVDKSSKDSAYKQ